uniref:Uncharacterized protein n=1 Tax=Nostoc flagelliforme str. Sunitezuoqi TaxID=676037 RepID=E7DPR6_9NOSO|nr:hypothetical protein Nfla_3904 [Nostoc flagelliforme str. Sunitezuoqi]
MGYALEAQHGEKHPDAKPLHGFTGTGVLEIVDDFEGDTYVRIQVFETQSQRQFQNRVSLINIPLVAIRHGNIVVTQFLLRIQICG